MRPPFNPATVLIPLTVDYQQMNLLLEGLGKLPFERVEGLYTGLRGHAARVMQQAEDAHNNPPPEVPQAPEAPAPVIEDPAP